MALQLSTNYKGVTADYWKVIYIKQDVEAAKTAVRVALYKDAAARAAGIENALGSSDFTFDDQDMTRAMAYTALKALPQFSGATDA